MDSQGSTELPTLPKLETAGCLLSCYQPNIVICLLSEWFYTRQQPEGQETSLGCPLCGGEPSGNARYKGEMKKQEKAIQIKNL